MDLRISRSMLVGSYHLSSIQAKSLLPNQGAPHSATPVTPVCASNHLSSMQAKCLLLHQRVPYSATAVTPELLQLLYAPLIICPRFKPSVSFTLESSVFCNSCNSCMRL